MVSLLVSLLISGSIDQLPLPNVGVGNAEPLVAGAAGLGSFFTGTGGIVSVVRASLELPAEETGAEEAELTGDRAPVVDTDGRPGPFTGPT